MKFEREYCKEFTHEWDNPKGRFFKGKPWVGIHGKWIRKCKKCGRVEEYSRTSVFVGWFHCPEREE